MAEEQKPVSVPETTPAAPEVVPETKPAEETPAVEAPAAAEDSAAAETPAEAKTEETPAAPAEEDKKEEVKPIEAGTLEHKGAPANFPKNLLFQKNHFWFGAEALEKEKLALYLKNEKATDVAHHVVSWAAETGKGLLFYGKETDKSTPAGVIQLADATEPTADGATKFTFTAKGHKHIFKAPSAADRDNWVEQLKLKIAEAKELATTVTESEAYKTTLESLKPAKKEKAPETTEEAAKETTEEPAAEEDKTEEPKEEKREEPKRRSASRKRASLFGNLLGGKKEESKKEIPAEDKPVEEAPAAEGAAEAAEADKPAEGEAPAADAAPTEEAKKEEVKPTPSKRQSIFGGLSFGKKKADAESAPATPAKEAAIPEGEAPVAETAPVIPAVETTEPLSAEVSSPTAEGADAAATNGEPKKEVKNEKRKSSLPFTFGKKEKAVASDEEGEKVKSPPFFSKLRQTVKGKGKAAEKPAEEAKAEDKPAEATEATPGEAAAAEPAKEEAKPEEPAPAAEEAPAEKPATPAPVTAAA
ncbi:Pleckstrin homology domain-containing protein [Biscogniauxia mediterranea]|nr:Pleckstrin homology domain-containing protein [Biscogniauxia mediterranea]